MVESQDWPVEQVADNVASGPVVQTCCTFAACVLISQQPVIKDGRHSNAMECMIEKSPLKTEEMP